MYLYHNNDLPISFTQIFQTGNKIFTDLITVEQIFSILFQSPRMLNSLPNNIKNAPTFNVFKHVIKPFLMARQDAA